MREIIFRGKRTDNGKWIIGFLVMGKFSKRENDELIYYTRPVIIPMGQIGEAEYEEDGHYYREIVIPETVGQYTGIKDKNGTKIFEGDIIKSKKYGKQHGDKNFSGYDIFEVRFVDGSFVIRNSDRLFYLLCGSDKEVIGNKHDNPELLKNE